MYSNTVNVLNLNEKPELILTAKNGDVVQVSFFQFVVSVKSTWSNGDQMYLSRRDTSFSNLQKAATGKRPMFGDSIKYLRGPNGAITMGAAQMLVLLKNSTFDII